MCTPCDLGFTIPCEDICNIFRIVNKNTCNSAIWYWVQIYNHSYHTSFDLQKNQIN